MTTSLASSAPPVVELIPIELVDVANPRVRNVRMFQEIVDNIASIGLKRPITVAKRVHSGVVRYDLVCGQGRLEAYQSLGQSEIPALVISASEEDSLIMSLVENLARRKHDALDLLRDIGGLRERGYTGAEIARKTGLSIEYVKGILKLIKTKEHRLLRAVESGHVPISVAIEIAEADDAGTQRILQQAYEKNILRGKNLMAVKRLIEARRRSGKGRATTIAAHKRPLSLDGLLRTYREDTDKKKLLIRKADATRERLLFVAQALRKLASDENFATLLRAEGLDTLPRNLADRVLAEGGG